MNEFTKGKWEYSVLANTQIPATLYANQNGNEIDIAVFEKWEQNWAKEEMKANAELIASAPDLKQQRDDLLKLCKEFMEKADNGSADFDDPAPDSIYLRAKAAIKKAQT